MAHSVVHEPAGEIPDRHSATNRLSLQDLPGFRVDGKASRSILRTRLAGVQPALDPSALTIEPALLRGDRAPEPTAYGCRLHLGVTQRERGVGEGGCFSDLSSNRYRLSADRRRRPH